MLKIYPTTRSPTAKSNRSKNNNKTTNKNVKTKREKNRGKNRERKLNDTQQTQFDLPNAREHMKENHKPVNNQ